MNVMTNVINTFLKAVQFNQYFVSLYNCFIVKLMRCFFGLNVSCVAHMSLQNCTISTITQRILTYIFADKPNTYGDSNIIVV